MQSQSDHSGLERGMVGGLPTRGNLSHDATRPLFAALDTAESPLVLTVPVALTACIVTGGLPFAYRSRANTPGRSAWFWIHPAQSRKSWLPHQRASHSRRHWLQTHSFCVSEPEPERKSRIAMDHRYSKHAETLVRVMG